jgi:hypothetical protein
LKYIASELERDHWSMKDNHCTSARSAPNASGIKKKARARRAFQVSE